MSAVATATVARGRTHYVPTFPYRVRLEVFEGPLDLLLYLVKRSELDISQVSIVQIADQFLEYLALMKLLDVELAGEFLVMAATLMFIKSRHLLPLEEAEEAEEGSEEENDPQRELLERLEEYRQIKEQAQRLSERIESQTVLFSRESFNGNGHLTETVPLQAVSVFDLLSVFRQMLLRAREAEETGVIERLVLTVPQKMMEILEVLAASETGLSFFDTIPARPSRAEVIVAFLAILELIRRRKIVVEQRSILAEIRIFPQQSATSSQRSAMTLAPPHPTSAPSCELTSPPVPLSKLGEGVPGAAGGGEVGSPLGWRAVELAVGVAGGGARRSKPPKREL